MREGIQDCTGKFCERRPLKNLLRPLLNTLFHVSHGHSACIGCAYGLRGASWAPSGCLMYIRSTVAHGVFEFSCGIAPYGKGIFG